jgi:hypothetical protein
MIQFRDTTRHEGAECLVLGDSIIRNVESKHVWVQCFPGIRSEQLRRVKKAWKELHFAMRTLKN